MTSDGKLAIGTDLKREVTDASGQVIGHDNLRLLGYVEMYTVGGGDMDGHVRVKLLGGSKLDRERLKVNAQTNEFRCTYEGLLTGSTILRVPGVRTYTPTVGFRVVEIKANGTEDVWQVYAVRNQLDVFLFSPEDPSRTHQMNSLYLNQGLREGFIALPKPK